MAVPVLTYSKGDVVLFQTASRGGLFRPRLGRIVKGHRTKRGVWWEIKCLEDKKTYKTREIYVKPGVA